MTVRLHRSERAIFREVAGSPGGVLLNLDSGEYRRVNEVGALIWRLLEGSPTRELLIRRIRDRIADPPATLDAEVDAFLDGMIERQLAERR